MIRCKNIRHTKSTIEKIDAKQIFSDYTEYKAHEAYMANAEYVACIA